MPAVAQSFLNKCDFQNGFLKVILLIKRLNHEGQIVHHALWMASQFLVEQHQAFAWFVDRFANEQNAVVNFEITTTAVSSMTDYMVKKIHLLSLLTDSLVPPGRMMVRHTTHLAAPTFILERIRTMNNYRTTDFSTRFS